MQKRLLVISGLVLLVGAIFSLPEFLSGGLLHSFKPLPAKDDQASANNNKSASTESKAPLGFPPLAQDRVKRFAEVEARANSRPMEVYGQVIDQFREPVAGVSVMGAVVLGTGFETNRTEVVETKTDGGGKFSFQGLHGNRFGVKFEKAGYAYNSKLYANWWDNYHPETENRATFVIYKLQGTVPLLHARYYTGVRYDGTSARFDIMHARKNPNGEFKVTLIRDPLKIRRGYDRFDWKVQFQIIGGGILESKDLYSYEAPAGGYLSAIEFTETRADASWTPQLSRTFYVHLPDGKYGRIDISLDADSERPEGTGMTIEEWLNPSGSRDLEFEQSKAIEPAR